MTLEETIKHAEEVSNKCQNFVAAHKEDKEFGFIQRTERCAEEYRQLAELLKELAERRKQPEIIRCGECKHNPKLEWFGCPASHLSEKQRPETAWCWRGERKTDGT